MDVTVFRLALSVYIYMQKEPSAVQVVLYDTFTSLRCAAVSLLKLN